ncbi:cytochrome P450 family monooxygenase (macronuclear) [Tetrahymena thermophila SB210]|uniref:Cytochrome P450 family monooxygenase n=2 Tax=Tetrahymena thermophila TaxID=5911 RepID=Q23BX9_TETTS|nr:cytochrome P450 family monooxygenase [Tetrahymena thermophila SB210]EAR93989.2 cytochrome P450 family monooxygenase [Tetrahymena thermophila SB210]|eukprot:XP_001014234.2 cytochrome P450 family monooxygenase [Tetrahymena thermophila SB210]
MYGDKIKIIYHFGVGLLGEYRKGLKNKNDSLSFLREMALTEKSKVKAYSFNIGLKLGYCFLDPELIKQVHQNHDAFSKMDISQAFVFLFSNSLLCVSGKEWQRQRHFLGKSFHFDEIKNYFPTIKEVSLVVSDEITQDLKNSSQKKMIQVVKTCEKVTSEVAFRAFFGQTSKNITIKREDGSTVLASSEIVQLLTDSFRILQTNKLLLLKYVILKRNSQNIFPMKEEKSLFARLNVFKDTCKQVIMQRKEELQKDPSLFKKNFLDLYLKEILLNENKEITIDEIIDNFCALFFAGTDTTGNMTGVSLYYLSQNPKIQEEARDEVINILKSRTQSQDPKDLFNSLAFEDLSQMPLVHSILKESLRLIPPAAAVLGRYANRDIEIGEFSVKKGDLVNTHFIYSQSNPDLYPNPEKFDPYRWMNQKEQKNAFNFTPFSLGPRNCIGQHLAIIEGKCMIANYLLNYNILPNPSQEPIKEAKTIYGLCPDNLVYFELRK